MDDSDLGVALSVTSLVMTLAQDNLEQYKGAYAKAAARLKRILIDGEYTTDYLYYKVPCPWLQIKLLRLLQYFPPAGKCGSAFKQEVVTDTMFRGHSCSGNDSRVLAKDPEPSHGDQQERSTEQRSKRRAI